MTVTESSDRKGECGYKLFWKTDPPHSCSALVYSLDEAIRQVSSGFTDSDYFTYYVNYALHILIELSPMGENGVR